MVELIIINGVISEKRKKKPRKSKAEKPGGRRYLRKEKPEN